MAGFIKVISIKIRKMGMDVNYMGMEICLLDIFHKIKSMAKAHFIGLVSVRLHVLNKLALKLSNIMEIGGEDYQMEKENIKKQMVIIT
jgi:hypothetical protein